MILKGYEVLYDPEDEELVHRHRWFYNKGYAETKVNGKTVSMHRMVMGLYPKGVKGAVVDHLNGNKLDNRKGNLRITTVQGNSFNRRPHRNNPLGVRGVQPTKNGKYLAYIRVDGKTYNLGTYSSLEEASAVYEEMRSLRNVVFD